MVPNTGNLMYIEGRGRFQGKKLQDLEFSYEGPKLCGPLASTRPDNSLGHMSYTLNSLKGGYIGEYYGG